MAEVVPFPSPAASPLAEDEAAPNPESRPPVSDEAARQSALDIRASCIIEAPAGSGKTGLLMQRYLKLLADDDVASPEEVLAITFTRKATTELRARVLTELDAAARDTSLPEEAKPFEQATRSLARAALARDRALGWSLLANPQRLRIRTIDSVCAEIVNALPLLSGSASARSPVEDAGPLHRVAAQRALLQLGGNDSTLTDALRTVLLHRDASLADCQSLLNNMLSQREQWVELVPFERSLHDDIVLETEVRPELQKTLETIVCMGLTRAVKAIPAHFLGQLTALAQRLSIEPGYKGKASPLAFCANRNEPPEAHAAHLEHWMALIDLLLTKDGTPRRGFAVNHLGFKLPNAEKPLLESLVAAISSDDSGEICAALCAVRCLPPARYPDDQWRVAKALFRILLHALAELKVLFAERGECDFAELALAAREALSADDGPADLSSSAGSTLRHLLVDEMQDTSSSQYELLKLLTQSWDGHSQTLFLVGDPKQSIYLFRQARVERFLRTLREQRLGDIPLTPLRLTANFRSQAALVRDFNHTFGGNHATGRIFPPPNDPSLQGADAVDVPFVEAVPVREQTTGAGIVWHTSVFGEEPLDPEIQPTGIPSVDHAAQEAIEIRRIIEQRLAMPLPEDRREPENRKPWRIAVLARARNHLSALVKELKAHKNAAEIPFRAINLDTLGELPEVQDCVALTRALLHPADRTAWLAVLHAPWCGLGLADLLALTGEGPGSDPNATIAQLVATRRERLSPTGQALLRRSWAVLEQAVATLGRSPLATHVERTWRSLGGDAPLSAERQANVLRFLSLLRDLEADAANGGGSIDLRLLSNRLEKLYAEPRGGDIQVDLLTIHNAKGLEWDLVLVPGLQRIPRRSDSVLLNWLELDAVSPGEGPTIVLAPIWSKGSDSDKLNKWLTDVRSKRERAEEKRLFYVAATRAREELHLFAAVSRNADGELRLPPARTLLKACWPAAQEHFAQLSSAIPAVAPPAFYDLLMESLHDDEDDSQGLALAASATPSEPAPSAKPAPPPLLRRLPLAFDPLQRFEQAATHRLPYLEASALNHSPAFDRPEGSFAVRAFGNVVHRFLQVLAARLTAGATADGLLSDLPSWEPRLLAGLRAEGLPPTLSRRESRRALQALTNALTDPNGRWLLSPRPSATSERALTFATASTLRVDRTFLAGNAPLSEGDTFIWIVDFKTTQLGPRSVEQFEAEERAKYAAQLEAYAAARRLLPDGRTPIMLALYYPLAPWLIHWPASAV